MKKFTSILVLMLITAGMASAQPQSLQVEPGSKGELPELPTMGSLEENHFVGLFLHEVGVTLYSSNWYDRYVTFSYPVPTEFEATSYSLEYRPHVDNGGWGTAKTIDGGESMSLDLGDIPNYSGFDFRLIINDGPYEGYVSNIVSMEKPGNIPTTFGWDESEDMYKVVGSTVGSTFHLNVNAYEYYSNSWHKVEYSNDDGYYRYKWYRMNPNTWEMTLVEGANASSYETSMDDCGYMLVMEITGDDEHCSLLHRRNFGMILLPVEASLAYVGNDGFVLNTNYVVPVNAFTYNNEFSFNGDEDTEIVTDAPVPAEVVSQRAPGQYVFRLSKEEYDGVVYDLNIPGTLLSFVYMAEWNDPPTPWYREAQIMSGRYMQSLIVQPQFNGELTAATVEVYARNIDDELTLFTTVEPTEDMEEGIYVDACPTLGEGCYIKVLKTDATLDTYYPNALLWTEAQPVIPGVDEEWNTLAFTVELQPVPEQLSGSGVIEGTINVETAQGARRLAPADAAGISVLLRVKGADIVASQETSSTGSYRFENLPVGTYEVLVNIDGCTMEAATEVTLTDDNNTATGIDYNVEDGIIAPAGQSGQTTGIQRLGVERQGDIYDLQGRRVSTLKKGIYIQGGSKFVVK